MSLCEHCERATFNGFPPEGSSELEVGTVRFRCSSLDVRRQRRERCVRHVEGEPRRFDKRGREMR